MPPQIAEILSHLASGMAGGLVTLLLTHLLSKERDKINRAEASASATKTRRKEFCAFLRGWRAEFDHRHLQRSGYMRSVAAFIDTVPTFVQQADIIRGDLTGVTQERFAELVAAIAKCRGSVVNDKDDYERLLNDFDELLNLSENV